VAGGDRADSLITGVGEGANKRGRVDRGRGRAGAGRGPERLTCGVGLSVAGAGAREVGRARPRASVRKREGGGLGPKSAHLGGERNFLFFFFSYFQIYFTFSFSIIPFFFKQIFI
jgi:hypothetical protein